MFYLGEVAWRLYDTYGFPIDLTCLMAEERKMTVDMTGYEAAKAHAQVDFFSFETDVSQTAFVLLTHFKFQEFQGQKRFKGKFGKVHFSS